MASNESASQIAKPVVLPRRDVPVAHEADVVVVGGGPGGFAAALQAARMGARTILVERFDMPGGVHTAGLQGSADVGLDLLVIGRFKIELFNPVAF